MTTTTRIPVSQYYSQSESCISQPAVHSCASEFPSHTVSRVSPIIDHQTVRFLLPLDAVDLADYPLPEIVPIILDEIDLADYPLPLFLNPYNNIPITHTLTCQSVDDCVCFSVPQGMFNVGLEPKTLDAAQNIADSLSTMVASIAHISAPVAQAVSDISREIQDGASQLNDSKTSAFTLLRKLLVGNSVPEAIIDHSLGVTSVLIFVATSIHFIYTQDKTSFALMIASGIATVLYSGVLGNDGIFATIRTIISYFQPRTQPQLDQGHLDDMITASVSLLSLSVLKNSKPDDRLKDGLRSLCNFGSIKKTLAEILALCVKGIQFIVNYVRTEFLSLHKLRVLDSKNSMVDQFLKETDILLQEVDDKKFLFTMENLSRLTDQITTAKNLQRYDIPKTSDYSDLVRAVTSQLHLLMSLKKTFLAASPEFGGVRQEPVGVMFIGGAGSGKSMALEHFNRAVCARILNDEQLEQYKIQPKDFVHNRQFEEDFWENFNCKATIIYFDDFGQNKTIAGQPANEFAAIIRCINTFPHSLHMAEIDKKGVTYNHAKFVMCTTNMTRLHSEAIFSDDAFKRRFDHSFQVCPKDEYCTIPTVSQDIMSRRIDFDNLPKDENGIASMHPRLLNFHEIDLRIGENAYTGRILSFEQVTEMLIQTETVKKLRYEKYQSELQQTFDASLQKREASVPQARIPFKFVEKDDTSDVHMFSLQTEYVPDADCNEYITRVHAIMKDANDPDSFHYFSRNSKLIKVLKGFEDPNFPHFYPGSVQSIILCTNHYGGQIFLDHFENDNDPEFDQFLYELSNHEPPTYLDTPVLSVINQKVSEFGVKLRKAFTKLREWISLGLSKLFVISVDVVDFLTSKPSDFFVGILTGAIAVIGTLGLGKIICSIYDYFFPIPFGKAFEHIDQSIVRYLTAHIFDDDVQGYLSALPTHEMRDDRLRIYVRQVLTNIRKKDPERFHAFYGEDDDEAIYYAHFEQWSVPESVGMNGKIRSKVVRAKSKSSSEAKAKISQPQMGFRNDSNGDAIMMKVIRKNQWHFYVQKDVDGLEFQHMGFLTMIKGFVGILPFHFIRAFSEYCEEEPKMLEYKIKLVKVSLDGDLSRTLYFSIRDFIMGSFSEGLDHLDLTLVVVPKKIQVCSDITEFFPTSTDINKIHQYYGKLFVPTTNGMDYRYGNVYVNREDHEVMEEDGYRYFINKSYRLAAHSTAGDCGALLTISNAALPKAKIFGIHVAGSINQTCSVGAISAAVYREDLLAALSRIDQKDLVYRSFDDSEIDEVAFSNPEMELIKELEKGPSQGSNTTISRSQMSLPWEPKTAPAILKPKNGINPFDIAIKNYCTPDVYMDQTLVDCVAENVYDYLNTQSVEHSDRRILSFQEAVYGIDGCPHFESLTRKASPGYPDNIHNVPGFPGKTRYMGLEANDFSGPFGPQLLLDLEELEATLVRGCRPEFVFSDCLKDERRPLDKVADMKTRLFSASPIRYLILFRKYFGQFMVFLNTNAIDNSSAVCVNPYSIHWDQLAQKLHRFGKDQNSIGAGDYSKFDGSEKPQIHHAILSIINRWYGDGETNCAIREILWLEVVNSRHVRGNTIYEWSSSLPSGHPLTVHINNLYNLFAFRLAWVEVNGGKISSLHHFSENVYLCVLGDDNIFSVSHHYREIFNEHTISVALLKYGLKYTAEDKMEARHSLRKITQVDFLKRTFRFCDILQRYVAPLQLDVVLEIPMWTRKSHDHVQITLDNVDFSIRELSLHGRKVFDQYVPIFEKECYRCFGVGPKCTSFLTTLMTVSENELVFH